MDTTSAINSASPCKCCFGIGTQVQNDGIRIICPCCGGTGLHTDLGAIRNGGNQ